MAQRACSVLYHNEVQPYDPSSPIGFAHNEWVKIVCGKFVEFFFFFSSTYYPNGLSDAGTSVRLTVS